MQTEFPFLTAETPPLQPELLLEMENPRSGQAEGEVQEELNF